MIAVPIAVQKRREWRVTPPIMSNAFMITVKETLPVFFSSSSITFFSFFSDFPFFWFFSFISSGSVASIALSSFLFDLDSS